MGRKSAPGTSLQTRQGSGMAPPKPGGKPAKRKRGKKATGPSAPLHDRRRRLVSAREATLRDLGGLMLEMYKRNRFREELLLDKCEEVLAVEVEIAHIDQRLFQLAPPNAAGVRPIGRCECGSPIYPGQNFCGVCGRGFATLTQNRMCERCGAGLRPGDSFCATCGTESPDVLDTFEVHSPPPLAAGSPTPAAPAMPKSSTTNMATPALDDTTVIPTPQTPPPPAVDKPAAAPASTPAPTPPPPPVVEPVAQPKPPAPKAPEPVVEPPAPVVAAAPAPVVAPPPVIDPAAAEQVPAARYEPPFAVAADNANETAIAAAVSSIAFGMPGDDPSAGKTALDFPTGFDASMEQAEESLAIPVAPPPVAPAPSATPDGKGKGKGRKQKKDKGGKKGSAPAAPVTPPAPGAPKPLDPKQQQKLEKMRAKQREKLAKDKAKAAQKRAKERAKAARKGGGKGA